MRIATFNVENLFVRARALNLEGWSQSKVILERFVALSELIEEPAYTPPIQARMVELLKELGIDKKNDSRFVSLRENRGQFVRYSTFAGTRIVARGRDDWSGGLELRTEIVDERSTRNTAQVVRDVAADVIAMIEVEDRRALRQFCDKLLAEVGRVTYDQTMLIDGNDDRGIDVGLMVRRPYRVGWMRSHVDDVDDRGRRIFSRDCPEYSIWTPDGGVLWLLVNHFKSKGFGPQEASNARRSAQAEAVRRIYERLLTENAPLIAVLGDLNDTPDSEALAPLLAKGDLKDVSQHPAFNDDGHPGTFQSGGKRDKLDYILLSPALFERVRGGGVWRKGVWGAGKKPPWDVYPEITASHHAASDHAAVWCDLEL